MKTVSVTAVVLSGFLLVTSALAQEAGGVKIQGNTLLSTNVGNAANVAIGQDNVAKQQIGTISGNVKIQGNTLLSTNVGNAANVAIGKGNKACQSIGVITGDGECK